MNALAEADRARALAPSVGLVELAAAHVHFDSLNGGATLEHTLFEALRAKAAARYELHGPDGVGKSSTIARLLRDLTQLSDSVHEVLLLEVGDPRVLKSNLAFAQHVIATIRGQSHRFASAVQEQIQTVGAAEITLREAATTHHGGVSAHAGVVSAHYGVDLGGRFTEFKWGEQPERAKNDLREIITALRNAGRRPVVVIDDTEKFALTATGEIDEKALVGLAHHAIPMLAGLDIDVLVATHPQFAMCAAYERARGKWLSRAEIPALSMNVHGGLPLGVIIDRHLVAHELKVTWAELLEPIVVHQLQALYFAWNRNLRDVLNVAQRAVGCASAEEAKRVAPPHLYRALA